MPGGHLRHTGSNFENACPVYRTGDAGRNTTAATQCLGCGIDAVKLQWPPAHAHTRPNHAMGSHSHMATGTNADFVTHGDIADEK